MGDFDINTLNYDSDKDTTDFIPTINTNIRVIAASKTLIGNMFYDFTNFSREQLLTS